MFVFLVSIIVVIGIIVFLIMAAKKKGKGEDLGERNQR
jgi:hypothetical protein